jgi:hypothetical protein
MDHDDDVERLFSWIKTPDLHYREFAGERDMADAVATWPLPRQPANETGRPGDRPEGHAEAETMPEPEAGPEPAPRAAGHSPLGTRLASLFARREAPAEPPVVHPPEPRAPLPEETAGEVPWASEPPRPSAIFARLEPTSPPPHPKPAPEPPPSGEQYHGFEEDRDDAVAAEPAHEGEGRSLDAIFSRVAHQPRAQRDDPRRPTGAAGLGSVFRRLR